MWTCIFFYKGTIKRYVRMYFLSNFIEQLTFFNDFMQEMVLMSLLIGNFFFWENIQYPIGPNAIWSRNGESSQFNKLVYFWNESRKNIYLWVFFPLILCYWALFIWAAESDSCMRLQIFQHPGYKFLNPWRFRAKSYFNDK